MVKCFAKYMRCGKHVLSQVTEQKYSLIEDMNAEKETVRAVSMDNWKRYQLLRAWVQNYDHLAGFKERFTGDIEECKSEMRGYETELRVDSVSPCDKIRFITSDYKEKFKVTDLSNILINGKVARVAYLDEYHFTFVDTVSTRLYGGCFHICQFAEICEKNRVSVEPIKKGS
ncbi:hypothetical protein OBV_p-00020 (plasmid) [Oscillibacter valericigenes Sjm18-20]|nr:hypothetical protein OBV_p-00020 [Oscillibacter valericigenes Sjm18-20]